MQKYKNKKKYKQTKVHNIQITAVLCENSLAGKI